MGIGYAQKLKLIFDNMTYSEEKLAKYIEEHRNEIKTMTSQELADKTGVGQSTVIRFSQKLGYGSFKKMISDFDSTDEGDIEVEVEPEDTMSETYGKLKNQYADVIDMTLSINDEKEIKGAIELISNAKRIIVTAFSEKNIIFARYLAYRFSFAGYNAFAMSELTSTVSHINMCEKNDVIIIISESGTTDRLLNFAKIAKTKGMKVISLTKKNQNPMQKISDINLKVINYGDRGFMRMSMVRISMLVVFDLILLNLVKEDFDDSEKFSEIIKLQTKLNYKAK